MPTVVGVDLSFDGEPTVQDRECPDCGEPHESVVGFVLEGEAPYAVYYADWYPHRVEAYIDVVLGPFEEPDYPDQVTFGCRTGHVAGQAAPASSLVTAAEGRGNHPWFGDKLTRDQALDHPLLPAFWEVVDWLILNDRILHDNVYHMAPSNDDGR